ncbi:hypothetical protein WJX79_009068 [Trebouxia sp. C0005]
MQSSMADQLQHLDEQLLQCELLPGEQAAVDEFRVWILQLRQRRHGELGPFPADDMVERSAWQARKEQLDAAMEPEIESERLLRGLRQTWEKHLERERLRELRFNLLGGQAKARQEAKAGMCPPPEKVCSSCRLTKPSTEFYTNKTAADMLHSLCKTCHGDKCRSRASGNYEVSVVDKHCRACGQIKPSEDFPRNRMNKDGLHSYCKPCQNAKCAQYQRNSLAAKQEGRPVAEAPTDVTLPEDAFTTHKECKACHEVKPLAEYYRSVTNRDGLVSKCKRCMAQSNQRKVTEPTVGEKQCSECGQHKPASYFYKNRTNKDGLFGKCKLCSEGTKKERALTEVTVDSKVCKSCGEEKPASDFTRYRMRRDGLYNWCKACDIWKRQERRKRKRDESSYTMAGGLLQGQGLQEEGSMDPDDDLGDDDIKDDDQLTIPYHGTHAHMHSIPHNPHQMGQPVPGTGLGDSFVTGLEHHHPPTIMQMVAQ